MSRERVLSEFKARALKTKNVFEQTKYQCELLKKQAIQLEKELQDVQEERKKSQIDAQHLQGSYQNFTTQNELEYRKIQKDQEEISNLKSLKKDLKRENDLIGHDIQKQSNKLEELMRERITLQQSAKSLGGKLQTCSDEKIQMVQEISNQNKLIAQHNIQIQGLNSDMDAMKQILAHSFHQE